MYGEKRQAQSVVAKNLEDRRPLEDPGVDGSIVLRQISKEWNGKTYTRFIWLRIGTLVAGSCEHSKEPPGCIKLREFLD
jgi:hypothetical protein